MTDIPKGTEIDGSITKVLDSRFLNSDDFIGQGTVGMTIDRIEQLDELKYENGTKDENAILGYFKGCDRPLKLCKTNIRSIIAVTGTNKPKEWTGKKIGIYAQDGAGFGGVGYGVRIDAKYKGGK